MLDYLEGERGNIIGVEVGLKAHGPWFKRLAGVHRSELTDRPMIV